MPFSFPMSRASGVFVFAVSALCSANSFAAQNSAQNTLDAAPHLPDLSSYNCANVAPSTTSETRHIGQVVNSRYYEWNEFYVLAGEKQKLACIGLMRPEPKQLTGDEAKAFLTSAFAVGSPASAPARAQSGPETTLDAPAPDPDNVKPEPLKRATKPPTPGTVPSGQVEQKSSTQDSPPVPAGKNFDAAPTLPSAPTPSKERSQSTPSSALEKPAPEKTLTVGVDDRSQIASTVVYPWNTLAYLNTTYPNGDSYRCTATIVSPYVVMTAGHCVHNKDRGGYIASARVYPAQNQSVLGDGTPIRPYAMKSDVQQAQTTSMWTQISGQDSYPATTYRHDFAAIQFKTPFTHTGTFMPILYGSTSTPVTSAGYSATVQNKTVYGLYAQSGNESNTSFSSYHSSHIREFVIDASGGNSGSPFFYVDQTTAQRYLVGSLSYGDDLDDQAGGPWYDSWNQDLVSAWASWTPTGTPTGSVSGLRVASAFSSSMEMVQSYLRFYNSGTTAGTIDVTIADYATGAILGTWTSPSLAAGVARQFSIQDVEDNAGSTFTKLPMYSLSVRPSFSGTFQNILWHKDTSAMTNITVCDTPTGAKKTLIDVHSSLVSTHPATIVIHNTGTAAAAISLGIYNAATGQRIGTYPAGVVPSNAQKITTIAALEQTSGISPGNSIYYYNIKSDTTFTGYLQHWLHNKSANIVADMTTTCTMTP